MPDKFLHQYKILFKKANTDLTLAITALQIKDKDFDTDVVYFHLQQAAEKYFKTLLACNGVHFEKVHDIGLLIDSCKNNEIRIPEFVDDLIDLNPYAVEGRYGFVVQDQIDDVDKYIKLLKRLREFAKESISENR